jgi:hypothetical protein
VRKCLEVLSDWERKLLKDHYESGRTDAEVGYDLLGGQGTRSARVLKAFRLRRNALQRLARLFIQGGPGRLELSTSASDTVRLACLLGFRGLREFWRSNLAGRRPHTGFPRSTKP